MVRINLLPWRAARRTQREKAVKRMMGGAVLGGLLLSLLFWSYLDAQVGGQQDRNAFLEAEIKKVEAEIKDIDELKAKKEALLSRKQVIEELQANRYQMVHLFDALMRTVPEGLVLTSLKQDGEQLTLEGRAQSNTRVATYMRNLESAGWVKNPDVTVIEATPQTATAAAPAAAAPGTMVDNSAASLPYMFTMRVALANPAEPRDPNAPAAPEPVVIQGAPAAAIQPLPTPAPAPVPAQPGPTPAPVQPAADMQAQPAVAPPAPAPSPAQESDK